VFVVTQHNTTRLFQEMPEVIVLIFR